jgi:hypothetical protein
LERCGEEGLETMVGRKRAEHPSRVENRSKVRAPVTPQIEQSKAGLCSEKSIDNHLVLVRLARTRGVDEPSPWFEDDGCATEQGELTLGEPCQFVFVPPPLDIGVAPYGAQPRARCIHKDSIEVG